MNEINIFELPVYKDANAFEMLSADELMELANDIKENGLREPIVIAEIDGQWMLLDGRNRREACRIAEIIPGVRVFEKGDEESLSSFVWSANGPRRHLKPGQRAIAYAKLHQEKRSGGDRKTAASKSRFRDFEQLSKSFQNNVSMARFILKHEPTIADLVAKDHPNWPLSVAYEHAKKEFEIKEEKRRIELENAEKLAELRNSYPDLATLVDEGRIYLHEALETAANRIRKAQEEAERIAREADEQERRQREEEEARMAEEERQRHEQERLEQERFEANRAAFHSSLSQLLSGSIIIQNPADCENPSKWKGTWTAFYNRYQIPIHEARDRLKTLHERIPFILETLEAMRDE